MPSPATTDLPRPKSWDEFEDITAEVFKLRWKTPNVTRNGRNGQAQNGVDIFGRARHLDGQYAGAQCKKLSDLISWPTIEAAVAEAEAFEPQLVEFCVATTAPRDVEIQKRVRLLNEARRKIGKYPVEVLFWEDICIDLVGDKILLAKFFPDWAKLTESEKVPSIDLKWLDEKGIEVDGALTVTAPALDLIDIDTEFEPYQEEELEELRNRSPKDLTKALSYNAAVVAARDDAELKTVWLKSHARARFDKGAVFGLSVGVDVVEAEDILVVLTLPPEIEVYEAQKPPKYADAPDIPHIPRLHVAERRISVHDPWHSEGFIRALAPAPLSIPRIPVVRQDPIWVEDREVHIRIRRMAKRRRKNYAGEQDGLVLVPLVPSGRFTARWHIDAENLPNPIEGELVIDVLPSPESQRLGLRRPYVGPKLALEREDSFEER
ncbi:MAG: hypothetical protein JNJ46_12565 [Myxococcales bacterium]|nr:hypothetical protein [Myxococcales bacterium]